MKAEILILIGLNQSECGLGHVAELLVGINGHLVEITGGLVTKCQGRENTIVQTELRVMSLHAQSKLFPQQLYISSCNQNREKKKVKQ